MIRTARPSSDSQAALEIYRPYVESSAVSFETELPSLAEFQKRIEETLKTYPWLVYEAENGEVAGYAYASLYRARKAYCWSVECSVYVHAGYRRRGIARKLYVELFETLRRQGFHNVLAVIALPNPTSVSLHEAMGFQKIAHYPRIGFKLGKWHDVGWWQLGLQDTAVDDVAVVDPIPFPDLVR